jgi:hypothetical protein
MTSASFEKMPPAVLSREYVTYLEKKKLSNVTSQCFVEKLSSIVEKRP